MLGFKNAGIIVANAKKNVLGFGDLTSPTAILAVIGLIILLILEIRKINGGVILAIILTTIIGIPLGVTKYQLLFLQHQEVFQKWLLILI